MKKEENINRKSKNNFLVVIIIFLFLVICVYGGGIFYFSNHFLPNTWLNGINISYLESVKAEVTIDKNYENFEVAIKDRDGSVIETINRDNMQLDFELSEPIEEILEKQNKYLWFLSFFEKTNNYNVSVTTIYNKEQLENLVDEWKIADIKMMEEPQDAYLSEYNSQTKSFEVIPETKGNKLNVDLMKNAIIEGLASLEEEISLEEYYIKARITSENEELIQKAALLNKLVQTKITYDWNGEKILLDGEIIKDWVVENENGIELDLEQLENFVKTNASANDTYGKRRNFVTRMGIELSLPSGAYGWRTDRKGEIEALRQLIYEGTVGEREPIYLSQGWIKGKNDIGNSYIEIDLTHQHLYVVENGEVVLETDFVSGDMRKADCVTPEGVFGLSYKTMDAVLRGEDYATPVKYWMPFNGNIGLHDATWRSNFGGDIYLRNGSHGCINLPYRMAEKIYQYVSTGSPIICYYYPEGVLSMEDDITKGDSAGVAS